MKIRIGLILLLTGALTASRVLHGQDGAVPVRRDTPTVRLTATRHPPLPVQLSQFWFVPDEAQSRVTLQGSSPVARVARGIQFVNSGDFAAGLPLLGSNDLGRSPLANYAQYYSGIALTALSRLPEAETAFNAVRERKPQGYLREAVSLRLAEAALARGDAKRAVELLDDLAGDKPSSLDSVLVMLGRAAEQTGDIDRALKAYRKAYYELPLTAGALDAQAALTRLQASNPQQVEKGDKLKLDRERAEALFAAKRWPQARAAYEALAKVVEGADASQVALRLAECDYYQNRFRVAREALAPFVSDGPKQDEARHFQLSAIKGLGDEATYVKLSLSLADDFPNSQWTEETLNNLASHYIRNDDEEEADRIFRIMITNFPRGRYGERVAWRVGWRAYRQANYREAAEIFERAAAAFPRADNRPGWIYWSARAHDLLNESNVAVERYALVIADYENSYYGRLAGAALGGRRAMPPAVVSIATTGTVPPKADPLANEATIRELVSLQLYEDALREVQYAQRHWGDSAQLQATTAFVRHNQGLTLRAEERFSAVRGAITTMRRAYPQFMAAGGEDLPAEVLRIIFPLDYWPLITKYSKLHNLDPYLVAALMAQESTFTAEIRSSANAYGLMQLIPSTGSRYAKKLGIRNYSRKMLTDPETNIRLGTEYFSDLMERFGGAHYALAGYNAGESRVQRWLDERPPLPADEFTDDIPFAETQTYVKRILGTAEDYRRLYGGGLLDPSASLSAQAATASGAPGAAAASSKTSSSKATSSKSGSGSSASSSKKKSTAKPATKKSGSTTTKRR